MVWFLKRYRTPPYHTKQVTHTILIFVISFAKAHVAVKNYAAKTNTVLILDKTFKNPDSSAKDRHTYLFGNNKISTAIHKSNQNNLGSIEKLSDNGLR
ncbi:hypothetical protein C2G38_2216191 [Gigaspora rosea]|uniref:Uncharacterized protein n=1 Tax=Gigaspora rosea TaxID=44941 RepID=A0A397UCC4_9GLOM|nr:hypothetical protein C2G38_2216191 [Gigaspora rosea]